MLSSPIMMVCIVLITLGIWIGLVFFLLTLRQVHRAANAVEILAYRLDESTSSLRNVTTKLGDFADKVRSGWMRALEMALATAATLWSRKQHENDDDEADREIHPKAGR